MDLGAMDLISQEGEVEREEERERVQEFELAVERALDLADECGQLNG